MTIKTTRIPREADIVRWAQDRNILGSIEISQQGTEMGQARKTLEEVGELFEAIGYANLAQSVPDYNMAKGLARDAIGDIIVTLAIQAAMWGLSLEECIEHAWQEIKDRKGQMVNGVFVKEKAE